MNQTKSPLKGSGKTQVGKKLTLIVPPPLKPPIKKLNLGDNMSKQNLPRMSMIRGQQTDINTQLCPVNQFMERQLKMMTDDREEMVDILSPAENDRRNKIVEAHLNLGTTFLIELTKLTAESLVSYSKAIVEWESTYKDFNKNFTIDLNHFNPIAKAELVKNKLDENTSEQIIKGITEHHLRALKSGSSFYKHLCVKMQTERSNYELTSSDICALESNIEKAIHQGFANMMALKIRNSLETTVAINDLTREVRNINIKMNVMDKRVEHNSHAIVETQKSITVSKMGEAEKSLNLQG